MTDDLSDYQASKEPSVDAAGWCFALALLLAVVGAIVASVA